jgi:glycosyltransferase involved in cell wall biosynthesis
MRLPLEVLLLGPCERRSPIDAAVTRDVPKQQPKRPVLVLTPATRFGSWAWIEKALEQITDTQVVVVSYGTSSAAPDSVRFVSLPAAIDYGRWGVALAERRFFLLNILYYAPLALLAWWAVLRYRPSVMLANGVFAATILGPLAKRDRRLILAFHGSIEHAGPLWHRVLRKVLSRVDHAFVNSTGSREDLGLVFDPRRMTVINHWADEAFFDVPLERPAASILRVLYVGRMDSEKFTQCLRVCGRLAADGVITLTTVGSGPLAGEVEGRGMHHLGYIADKHELAAQFANADVVWGAADVTYVTLPGIEALAAGCPVVISDVPAVFTHADAGLRVPRAIIPPEVGAVVDGDDDDDAEAIERLRRWATEGVSLETRRACREYARRNHSSHNIDPVVAALSE